MDQEAEELGGKTKFFTGEFEKFAWSEIMDSKLGGRERLDLYAEGIQKMNQNKNIPQLFRDIFKDAFLPYRDPETLNLFLKEINNFTYDHSEQLGNAFEYLLSVMGSQGKAGQFRTPRHIIEFIVDVVDPGKDDTILDPACGTAGFLISAYKHILEKHTKKDKLTPDQRERLTRNFAGYDISPDMVRLSLVNMYLHKFPAPQIYEYDALSSEERWSDRFDVIMANPPFMTPKGGIRPHKRFAIQANRAELLFVDYIAEHLTPHGRAGVIVPEGIIFQSSNAYKNLRKMLVEDSYLWAVASLPAGIFNPYAGVKTSILFLDKVLAKQTKDILFVKIENDGFDLGAQRRPVISNDLPMATEALVEYRKHVLSGGKLSKTGWPSIAAVDTNPLCQFVSKKEIAKSGDYNLSGDRYKESVIYTNQKWPTVELGEICEMFDDGDWIERKDQSKEGIRLVQTGNIGIGEYLDKGNKVRFISEETFKRLKCKEIFEHDLLISRLPDPVGRACLLPHLDTRAITAVDCTIIRPNKEKALPKYLLYVTQTERYFQSISQYLTGASRKRISRKNLQKIKIPLPPLEIQKQIVAQIEAEKAFVDSNKKLIEIYEKKIKNKIEEVWGGGR